MDIVERLRAYEWREVGDIGGVPLNRRFLSNPDGPEAADEIERLREALQKIADGDVERVSAEKWRTDGKYSKLDKCKHGLFMYEECGECVREFVRAALKETE